MCWAQALLLDGDLKVAEPKALRYRLWHFVTQVGTGLRPGELLGLPPHRARPADGVLEVVEVRYDSGKFGRGYKDRPKSQASIRQVPLPKQVAAAIAEALIGCPADGRIFAGPGGNRHARRGERTTLSVGNYRRVYKRVVDKAAGMAHLDLRGPHDLRHLRDLARRRRHPVASDRRAYGPLRRPAARGKSDGQGLPPHHARDAGQGGRGGRGSVRHRLRHGPGVSQDAETEEASRKEGTR